MEIELKDGRKISVEVFTKADGTKDWFRKDDKEEMWLTEKERKFITRKVNKL